MLSGAWVCDECWLDVAMDIQQHHFSSAKIAATNGHPPIPKASRPPSLVRHKPGTVTPPSDASPTTTSTSKRPRGGDWDALGVRGSRFETPMSRHMREALASVVKPGYNSICMICTRIYYGARIDRCTRCGGLCRERTDHDFELQQRYPIPIIDREVEG